MGWTTLQSADDAARTLLTHRCRHRPGLKLRPEHCETYMAKCSTNPWSSTASMAQQCKDWACPGPVEIRTEPTKPKGENVAPKPTEREYPPPSICKYCGESAPKVTFYASRPDACKGCIESRRLALKAAKDNGEQPAKERAPDPPKTPEYKYTCPEHGPHNGWRVGNNLSPKCPTCEDAKRMDGLKAHYAVVHGAREMLTKYPWLDAWMTDQAVRDGLENRWEALAVALAEAIPAEWFKAWALRK